MTVPTVQEEKRRLRALCRTRRASLPLPERQYAALAIVQAVRESEVYHCADLLLLYAALPDEVDLTPLAIAARHDGKEVAYPRCGDGGTLTFHVCREQELHRGYKGIAEPAATAPVPCLTARTLCLVPALAFDRHGFRLGYGGGYYDRFLPAFCGTACGVLYHSLLFPSLPREEHDVSVPLLVSEKGVCLSE